MKKIGQMGVVKGSRDILLKFRNPLHISGTVEARNFKVGMHIDHDGHKQTKSKIRSEGIMCGHAIHFCNFGKGVKGLVFSGVDPLHTSVCSMHTIVCRLHTIVRPLHTIVICSLHTIVCRLHTSVCSLHTIVWSLHASVV